MTAEIAVMNKTAVALAADSAVTVRAGQNQNKIYKSANKLFTLSKYQPVGTMIYGNATLMQVPWEVIIKEYRESLGNRSFDHLKDYTSHFLRFIEANRDLFPADFQEQYLELELVALINSLVKKPLNETVKEYVAKHGQVTDTQLRVIAKQKFNDILNNVRKSKRLEYFPKSFGTSVRKKYKQFILNSIHHVFEEFPLTPSLTNKLVSICSTSLERQFFPDGLSGIVIAGFGTKDVFPRLQSLSAHLLLNNRLRYEMHSPISIGHKNGAAIRPFAQTNMVQTFMEGIDPDLNSIMYSYLRKMILAIPSQVSQHLGGLKPHDKAKIDGLIKKFSKALQNDVNRILDVCRKSNADPVVEAVAVLPKDELAAMAESLVSLTSFKKKVTLKDETVGGPIDVAVISKGDGFIWISRKHYFEPDLNHHFFENYFKQK